MNLSSSMVCFSVHNGQYSQSSDNLFFNVSVNVERKEQPDVAAWVLARMAKLEVPPAARGMKAHGIKSGRRWKVTSSNDDRHWFLVGRKVSMRSRWETCDR